MPFLLLMLRNDPADNISNGKAFFVLYLEKSESDSLGAISLLQKFDQPPKWPILNYFNEIHRIIIHQKSAKIATKNQIQIIFRNPGPFLNVYFLIIPNIMINQQRLVFSPQIPPIANFAINTSQ